jgi:uncharacterized membrane protein
MAGTFAKICAQKQLVITIIWIAIQVFLFCYMISAFSTAAEGAEGSSNGRKNFAYIWTGLLACMLSVGGTLVMKKYRSPLAVGFFIGVSAMMSMNMLITAALSGGDPMNNALSVSGEHAVTAFAVFLFISYLLFAVVLALFRNTILAPSDDQESLAQNDAAQEALEESTNV